MPHNLAPLFSGPRSSFSSPFREYAVAKRAGVDERELAIFARARAKEKRFRHISCSEDNAYGHHTVKRVRRNYEDLSRAPSVLHVVVARADR